MRRGALLIIMATAALLRLAPSQPASAQEFPQRTVTIIVPSAPGGTLDALARFFGQAMGPALGRSVVVENVSGAGGLVGLQRLARAEPDGHTIVFGNMGVLAAAMALNPDSGFDPRRDLAPIGVVANVPMVLAASPASGIRNLPELTERIRQRGERVSFGTAGNGTTSHLAPGFLLHLVGLKATLVAYRGSGPAMNELAAGVVDAVIDQTFRMFPAHRGGQVALPTNFGLPAVPQPTVSRSHRGAWHEQESQSGFIRAASPEA
jgi:tripartite-type tricarboxylate transporter receptor subunit TctC